MKTGTIQQLVCGYE